MRYGFSPLLLVGVLGCASVRDGADVFEAGRVDAAIAAWEPALATDPSPAVLYDLGCAWYRKGDRARALAYWRAARLRQPWSGALAHNLALARSEIEDAPDPVGPPVPWMHVLTVTQVGVAALLCLVVGFALTRRPGHTAGALAAWSLGVASAVVAIHGAVAITRHPVSVVVEASQARDAPRADAAWRFHLPRGSEVRWVSDRGDFVLVETGDDRRGWVARSALLTVGPWTL